MRILKYLGIIILFFALWNQCFAADVEITVSINGQKTVITPSTQNLSSNMIPWVVAQHIKKVIIDSAIQKSNIVVSDVFLSQCMDLYLSAGDQNPTNVVNVVSSRSKMIVDALRKVVLEHEGKDIVYSNYLSQQISHSEWNTWLGTYNTKEKIDKLEELIPNNVSDLKRNSEKSLKADIETWLLYHLVTKDVAPSPEEIKLRYNTLYPAGTPPLASVEDKIRMEIMDQLKEEWLNNWWQNQVLNCQIILPPEFSEAKQLVNKVPQRPFLPESIISILQSTYGK